jgi:hypothetical protein
MGCKLLRELFALFSEQKPYIKVNKQPFLDALAPIKNILEQSGNPDWNALGKRLETAPLCSSANVEYFIYPISGSKDIYLRKTILNDLQQVCEDLKQDCVKVLKEDAPHDQRDQAWTRLLNASELLNSCELIKTAIQPDKQPKFPQDSSKPFEYKPL